MKNDLSHSPFGDYVNFLTTQNNEEKDLYFYHSDHTSTSLSTGLGSSSFITDATGITSQHLQYLPYGELFVDQRTDVNYFTPYKFSAKEKDEETGYSYFGARYFESNYSIWLTPDPLSDKYPNISPYAYCNWNPVRLVDPDGRDIVINGEASDKAVNQLQNKTNLKLTRDNETGNISYEGKVKNKIDKQIAKMIDNKKIKVNITAKNTNKIDEKYETNQYGGAYLGNSIERDANNDIAQVNASQFVNPDVIEYWDKKTNSDIGEGMLHEFVEAYAGGEIAWKTGKGSSGSIDYENSTYEQAHKIANKIAPGDIRKEVHLYSQPISFELSKNVLKQILLIPVHEKILYRKIRN